MTNHQSCGTRNWYKRHLCYPIHVIAIINHGLVYLSHATHSQHGTSPLRTSVWYSMLESHPNKELVQFMICAIHEGCHIGFNRLPPSLKSARSKCARDHPDVESDYLSTEVSFDQIAGSFPPWAVSQVHISHFRVISKGHWRLIIDLSNARDHSVNDEILKSLCYFKYVTIDEAIKWIIHLGPGILLAKIDIKSLSACSQCFQQTGTC